jgi:UDP-N-acetylglucosamine--N-acetylmuramyl-(pentapeptide) pyrophosphoryl-undecaprenol N-acetylglucosamine transferase
VTGADVFAVVTGGGTGGHVTPALAIADELVARGHDRRSIRFVGARRGREARAVPAAGYEVELLTLDGVQRSLAPRALLRTVRALLAFVLALAHCVRTLRRQRPAVVVGVGGYASAPCVFAARVLRIPTVVHEQNAVPGVVNRIAVRLGARPAVSFPGTAWRDAVVTGNPIRADVAAARWQPVVPPRLAVVGGSQGAGRLNDVALGLYDRWRERTDVAIRHVAGPKHAPGCRQRLAELRRPGDRLVYELVEFEDDMPRLYAASALVLCRSGATTVAEVAAVGVPAVFVPWSGAAEGQQDANAAALVAAGGAVVVADAACTTDTVEPIVASLLADPARRHAMAQATGAFGRPDAAARVGAVVEECARAAA